MSQYLWTYAAEMIAREEIFAMQLYWYLCEVVRSSVTAQIPSCFGHPTDLQLAPQSQGLEGTLEQSMVVTVVNFARGASRGLLHRTKLSKFARRMAHYVSAKRYNFRAQL
jgi:hypothetical protein